MTFPAWLKPALYGGVAGAALAAFVGFSWGGWMTGAAARDHAMEMAHDDVVAALTPVCLSLSAADPDQASKLETIRAASVYQRRDAVMKTGWATVPGAADPDRDLAQACLAELEL